jgi:outer membrane protein assembly factor BamB
MKLFYIIIIFFFLNNCSFDKKSGIWKNESQNLNKESKLFSEFENISSTKDEFYKIIELDKNYKFSKNKLITNTSWKDIYYFEDNNLKNLNYDNQNQLIFKSKKLTKYKTNNYILYEKDNIITSDVKGNVIVFSVKENKEIIKFNFYKKRYKKNTLNLNLAIENSIIYVSDNLGFIYAFDYKNSKLLWAQDYKIPLNSNIKITQDKIILADQNNSILFIDKKNGINLKVLPTEISIIKKNFINNLAVYRNNVIFLNTYGSLYSFNINLMKINWFINLNQSLDINPNNLFSSNQVQIVKNKVYVPTGNNLYVLDLLSGAVLIKKDFSSILRPIVLDNVLYSIDNNFLISMDLNTEKILYSYDINERISNFLDIDKKKVEFHDLIFMNNQIFIFLKNSYVLKFNVSGDLSEINKLPAKIISKPIIVNKFLIFLDKKNKVSVVN